LGAAIAGYCNAPKFRVLNSVRISREELCDLGMDTYWPLFFLPLFCLFVPMSGEWNITRSEAAFALAVFFALSAVALVLEKYGQRISQAVVWQLGLHVAQIAVSITVLAIGGLAHWFKSRNQSIYGLIEITFAASIAFSVTSGLSPDRPLLSQWATLGGCAYIVTRGLSNISEAKKLTSRYSYK
jgi:hypothetical protein